MTLVTNLLIGFACSFCATDCAQGESRSQAAIVQSAEPGLMAAHDAAKITIKE